MDKRDVVARKRVLIGGLILVHIRVGPALKAMDEADMRECR